MKKIMNLMVFVFLAMASNEAFAQFQLNASRSIFSDVRAYRVGDALTILIIEDTQADNSTGTDDSRSTDVEGGFGVGVGTGSSQGNARLGTGTSFRGKGQTGRSERIRSRLSAKVIEVEQSTGNLVVEANRVTKINGETQTVQLKGIVRPVDIQPSNSINSYDIMDLTLVIEGDGSISQSQEPGFITRFLRILF